MSIGALVLHPQNPWAVPEPPGCVASRLREIGFIGASWGPPDQGRFLIGDGFLSLITFLGCSPNVEIEPPADGSSSFCHVALLGPMKQPVLVRGSNTRPPRCPSCRSPEREWRRMIEVWETDKQHQRWTCTRCGAATDPGSLDWRRSAGIGRFFVQIFDVFPEEAVPLNRLLEELAQTGCGPWRYFYHQPLTSDDQERV